MPSTADSAPPIFQQLPERGPFYCGVKRTGCTCGGDRTYPFAQVSGMVCVHGRLMAGSQLVKNPVAAVSNDCSRNVDEQARQVWVSTVSESTPRPRSPSFYLLALFFLPLFCSNIMCVKLCVRPADLIPTVPFMTCCGKLHDTPNMHHHALCLNGQQLGGMHRIGENQGLDSSQLAAAHVMTS